MPDIKKAVKKAVGNVKKAVTPGATYKRKSSPIGKMRSEGTLPKGKPPLPSKKR